MLPEQLPSRIFTPGPVAVAESILQIGACQPPYNRTSEFSAITNEILNNLKNLFATKGDVVILTSSGTGAMEAAVSEFLHKKDRVLIVNGGTFGQRWVDLCKVHEISTVQIKLEPGQSLSVDKVERYLSKDSFDAVLINAHETSTGVLYDIPGIGREVRQHGALFIVDAISTICADPFQMDEWLVDVAILSSHKALALPPGLSFVAFNRLAKKKLRFKRPKSLYFDLTCYLENQKRGQMPFTPAIGLFMMLYSRLQDIEKIGIDKLVSQQASLAKYFRSKITDFPFKSLPQNSSNALTALYCEEHISAPEVVRILQTKYKTFVAPNGGALRNRVFRVGHMGDLKESDIDFLVDSLRDIVFEMDAHKIGGLNL